MFRDLLQDWNVSYQRRRIDVQLELNKILFNQEFELEGLFQQITNVYKKLEKNGLQVTFHTVKAIATGDNEKLKKMAKLAESLGYDDAHEMLIKPDCTQCELFHKCSPAAYFAIFRMDQLYALMQIDGKDIYAKIQNSNRLKIYFQSTAAKISYRLSDHFRTSNLMIANLVLEGAREAVVITDIHGTIVRVNKAFSHITGYSESEAVGQNPRILQSGKHTPDFYQNLWKSLIEKGIWSGEFGNKTKQGKEYYQRGTIRTLTDLQGNTLFYVAVMEDVTLLREQEASLNRLSLFDSMTGLPNRQKLQNDFDSFRYRKDGTSSEIAAIIVDLDDFKHINDAMGHNFGDEVLKSVAERLLKTVDHDGLIYRFGGDEFVVVTEYKTENTLSLVERVIREISGQFYIQFKAINLSCTVGIAISGRDGHSLEQLLSRADMAMYWAKEHNRSSFAFSSDELHKDAFESLQLRTELSNAINQEQLSLVYQPKCNINNVAIVGCEALVRWEHPTLGRIGPDRFIPVAEKSGQIVHLDFWVLEAVLRQLSSWRMEDSKLIPVAVNISLPTFIRNGFVNDVKALLDAYNIDGQLIEFEITERVALGDISKTQLVMSALTQLGIKISMDDFGTGYSSLSYLNTMPISTLKIDRAFVSNIPNEPTKQGITGAIVAMAKVLNISTVAEGVETQDELEYLTQIGCDQLQGFFFARPMEPYDFIEFIKGY